MDILTHAVLGALSATLLTPKSLPKLPIAFVGGFSALAPDLDVLIRSTEDPLLVLEYHRHFSHSLFFAPLATLILSLLYWPLWRKWTATRTSFSLVWLSISVFIGYTSACLLDVCTSYGTHLFWPWVTDPISLNLIAVVDPLFTVLLMAGLAMCFIKKNAYWPWMGLAMALLYLGLGYSQHQRAIHTATQWAHQEHFPIKRIIAKPTMANQWLWRVLIIGDEQVYVTAYHLPLLRRNSVTEYSGGYVRLISFPILDRTATDHSIDFDPAQANTAWSYISPTSRSGQDLQRFSKLAYGIIATDPKRPNRIGDLRYALLPNSAVPIWGIEIDVHNPEHAPSFYTAREFTPDMRKTFIRMLQGKPLATHAP